jgi:hypothetical protein
MARAIAVVLALVAAIVMVVLAGAPPAAVPATAPPTEFSGDRAMRTLAVIAARPHPTGTLAADEVRATLVQQLEGLGLEVAVQDATSLTDAPAKRWGVPVVAAHVHNVVAWRQGAQPGPSLLLVAHYDSRELAPGASDDGYGTAALLETARALMASPPLRHDVVFLFTEGEEEGLLGARAFVEHHPLAHDVGLTLNFEARGDRGPVFMFQTGEQAGALIDVLAAAAPHVAASSMSQEVYRRMPNDTDLTVWLRAGHPGMNFANVDGFERYHQPTDSLQNADAATVQHHGSYALALARAFGDADALPPPATGDEVYFTTGVGFVHYAVREATTLAGFGAGLLLVAIVVGTHRRRLHWGGWVTGAAVTVLAVVAAALVASGLWWVARRTHGGALEMQQLRDGVRKTLLWSSMALGAAIGAGGLVLARRRVQSSELGAGAMLSWAGVALVSAFYLPGASYLFAWPLVLAGAAWCLRIARPRLPVEDPGALALHVLPAAATILLLVPLGLQLGVAFGPGAAPALAGLGALVSVTCAPLLFAPPRRQRWIAPALVGSVAVVAWIAGCVAAPFDEGSPKPDSILYAIDTDRGEASWLSFDAVPDEWTVAVLKGAELSPMPAFFPRSSQDVLHVRAPLVTRERPRVDLVSDRDESGARVVGFHVTLPEGTEAALIEVPPASSCRTASVQGRPFGTMSDGWLDLAFFGPPPAGLDLEVTCGTAAKVDVRVLAELRGLPQELAGGMPRRPPDRMAAVGRTPLRSSDVTLVGARTEL